MDSKGSKILNEVRTLVEKYRSELISDKIFIKELNSIFDKYSDNEYSLDNNLKEPLSEKAQGIMDDIKKVSGRIDSLYERLSENEIKELRLLLYGDQDHGEKKECPYCKSSSLKLIEDYGDGDILYKCNNCGKEFIIGSNEGRLI